VPKTCTPSPAVRSAPTAEQALHFWELGSLVDNRQLIPEMKPKTTPCIRVGSQLETPPAGPPVSVKKRAWEICAASG